MESTNAILWPLLFYGIAVVAIVSVILLISYFIGERHEEPATNESYEGGIESTGDARLRFPVHFYLIAMFFVIFDVAAVFIISWAISIREVRWTGYVTIILFTIVLSSTLLYLLKIGALDFGPDGNKILKAFHERIKKNSI